VLPRARPRTFGPERSWLLREVRRVGLTLASGPVQQEGRNTSSSGTETSAGCLSLASILAHHLKTSWLAVAPDTFTARRLSCEGNQLPRPGDRSGVAAIGGGGVGEGVGGVGGWGLNQFPGRGFCGRRLRLKIQGADSENVTSALGAPPTMGTGGGWQRDRPHWWSGRERPARWAGVRAAPRARSGGFDRRKAPPRPATFSRLKPRREADANQPK